MSKLGETTSHEIAYRLSRRALLLIGATAGTAVVAPVAFAAGSMGESAASDERTRAAVEAAHAEGYEAGCVETEDLYANVTSQIASITAALNSRLGPELRTVRTTVLDGLVRVPPQGGVSIWTTILNPIVVGHLDPNTGQPTAEVRYLRRVDLHGQVSFQTVHGIPVQGTHYSMAHLYREEPASPEGYSPIESRRAGGEGDYIGPIAVWLDGEGK